MSEKHTPGPWKHGGGLHVTSNGVPDRFVRASRGIVAYCEGPINEARANARLIAAAPDLLAVLRECAEFLPRTTEGGSDRGYALQQSIRAAIAKATGA